MLVERVKLRNFRALRDVDLALGSRVCVVTGMNGTGKSSFLDAIGLLLGSYVGVFDDSAQSVPSEADIRRGCDGLPRFPCEIGAEGSFGGLPTEWGCSMANKAAVESRLSPYYDAMECRRRLLEGDSELVLPIVARYRVGHAEDGLTMGGTGEDDRISAYGGFQDARLVDPASTVWHAGPRYDRLASKAVRDALSDLIGTLPGLPVAHGEGGCVVGAPCSRLGDGHRAFLDLFGDIACRIACLNPQLGESALLGTHGIVLVDDIGLHMHPRLQQAVLPTLASAFPKVQFVVTTHSPCVASSLEGCQVVELSEDGSAHTTPHGLYGRGYESVLREHMATSGRQPEVSAKFGEFYDLVSDGRLEEAGGVLDGLGDMVGWTDVGVTSCAVELDLAKADWP